MKLKRLVQIGCLMLCTLAVSCLLPGCSTWDGHFDVFGYTTRPMYDLSIRTVRVPIFKNVTYFKGMEFQVTQAVIREIESKTPYKVIQNSERADTELLGTLVNTGKAVTNINQLGENRAAELTLTCDLVWRDLRPGHAGDVLSQPIPGKPGDAPLPLPPVGAVAPPVSIQVVADYIPELGQSNATAEQLLANRLAVQIVSMMEKPW